MTPIPELIRVEADGPVRAAFSTRRGGTSGDEYASLNLGRQTDTPSRVWANRRAVCEAMGADPAHAAMLTQVHGARLHRVGRAPTRAGGVNGFDGWPEADGLVTDVPGRLLIVLAADCLPVLLWRRDTPRVAAVHAGWRGMVDGVVEEGVRSLGDPACTAAALGPAIGPCCYPVSDDVRRRFASRFGDGVVSGRAVDLAASATMALTSAGVPAEAIARYGGCTSCDGGRFFSHRASGGAAGRQAGLIMIVP